MFETSVVRAQATAARGRYSLLTISLMAHSAVILGAIAVSVATVNFPLAAPDEMVSLVNVMPVQIPPPLGTPDGGKKPDAVQPAQKPPTPPPANQITAPPAIPDEVTPVQNVSTGPADGTGPDTGTTEGPKGVPWGDPNSPGDLDAPPVINAGPPVEEKIYTAGGEVIAPEIIRRTEPVYPRALQVMRLSGKVVVRCVIDKNGHVRDAQVVFSKHPAFSDSVLKALQSWRYKPASMRGQAVDCYLDLTVDFGVR